MTTEHTEPDQQEIFAFLAASSTYGRPDPVLRFDTHGAAVFLAGPDVYKVKRAIRLPFMDFSTLERRHAACLSEIAVNAANAPQVYIGVVPIIREGGKLRLGREEEHGAGNVVEWAVHLKRFDENATLDRLAADAPLAPALIDKLAHAIVDAHRLAPIRDGHAATSAFHRLLDDTIDELAGYPDLFPAPRTTAFATALRAAYAAAEPLLLRRGAQGQVRQCHGDLHLGNIVLIDGEPVLFDAIEFDDAIATSDILYDLAFTLMDLCERGLRENANRLLNRYFALCDDPKHQIDGLAALPLFLSLRAAIRAKVIAARLRQDPQTKLSESARGYFDAAAQFLVPMTPTLVAVGGLSGSGKSTLAAHIAGSVGRAPGAVHLRSDIVRKRLFGVAETERLPEDAYRPEISAKVYESINALAEAALRAGQSVIVDATHQRPEDRAAIAAIAARAGAVFLGLWLQAPTETLKQRVTVRKSDASDADATVVARQARENTGTMDWRVLNSTQELERLGGEALEALPKRLRAP